MWTQLTGPDRSVLANRHVGTNPRGLLHYWTGTHLKQTNKKKKIHNFSPSSASAQVLCSQPNHSPSTENRACIFLQHPPGPISSLFSHVTTVRFMAHDTILKKVLPHLVEVCEIYLKYLNEFIPGMINKIFWNN